MTSALIRNKLYDFIRVAGDKKLQAIYVLLESEIENESEWWKDEKFVVELDRRSDNLENGNDKGMSPGELETSIAKLRQKKYGK